MIFLKKNYEITFIRPFASDYFDMTFEKIRNTMYHEFGHHAYVKKQKKITEKDKFYATPPIELKLGKLRNKLRWCYIDSDANSHEWFAENFSLSYW